MQCGDFSAPWLVSSHAYRMGFYFSVRNTRRNVFMMTQPITDKPILYHRTLGKMRTGRGHDTLDSIIKRLIKIY